MHAIPLAAAILAVHLAVIAFNAGGLIVIPLGAWRGWRLVRIGWLRLLHLALLAIVAGQALAGRACILTIWQNDLTGQGVGTTPGIGATPGVGATPLVMRFVSGLITWSLPMWVFAALYVAVFLYVVALSVFIPFGRRHSPRAV